MIIIGADHGGFKLKEDLVDYFKKNNIEYLDVTDYEINLDDDYVDVAINLCKKVLENDSNIGIGICGTGVGMSIACNKIKGIIAGNCFSRDVPRLLMEHNKCNVLCFGGRLNYNIDDVVFCINEFISSECKDERHIRRVNKIKMLEEKFGDI